MIGHLALSNTFLGEVQGSENCGAYLQILSEVSCEAQQNRYIGVLRSNFRFLVSVKLYTQYDDYNPLRRKEKHPHLSQHHFQLGLSCRIGLHIEERTGSLESRAFFTT